jgi:uncharacterized Zn finger protein
MTVSEHRHRGHDYMDVGGRITSGTVIEAMVSGSGDKPYPVPILLFYFANIMWSFQIVINHLQCQIFSTVL